MKTLRLFFTAILAALIVANCQAAQNLPSDISTNATSIASTVEAGVDTVQTILTPPSAETPTPQPTFDLTTVCIPPLDMTTQLTELTLADGRKLVVTNGWMTLFNTDGTPATILLVPAERDKPLLDLDVSIETFRCESTNVVHYNPDTVK
jgi:hypothetical protein